MGRLRAYFMAGVLITAPISITVYLAWLFITYVDSKVTPLIPDRYNPETYLPYGIPGLGVVVVVVSLMVIGAFSQFRRGNQILGDVGRYLLQSMTVPVLMSH